MLSYCCYNSTPQQHRNLNWNQAKTLGQHLPTAVRQAVCHHQLSLHLSSPFWILYLFFPDSPGWWWWWCVGWTWPAENIQMKYFLSPAWYFLFLIYAGVGHSPARPSISLDISMDWLAGEPHHQSEYKENCDNLTTDNYFISKIKKRWVAANKT